MFNLHTIFLRQIDKALRAATWKKDLTEKSKYNWISSFVGRRLLHREIIRTGMQRDLDAVPLNRDSKVSFLTDLQLASKQIPPGSIFVDGDMSQLRTSDWLDIELNALKQILMYSPKKRVSAAEILDRLPYRGDAPAFVREFMPRWIACLSSPFAVVFGGFAGILGLLSSLTGKTPMFLALMPVSVVLITSFMVLEKVYQRAAYGETAARAAEDISCSWEDVFAMRNDMDAVLLGSLFGVINTCRSVYHDNTIPDFLQMSPQDAYRIVMRVLDGSGDFHEECASSLVRILTGLMESESGNAPHMVEGVDLSGFQTNRDELAEQPTIENFCNQHVDQRFYG